MIKVLIFDLDDTLYYEKEYVYSGFKAVCEFLGNKYSKNIDLLYSRVVNILDEQGRGKIFDLLCSENNFNEDIHNLVNIYRNCKPELNLYEDGINILNYAKANNFKLGLITDGCSKVQWNKIKALDLEKYMDKIIVTNDYGEGFNKPHERSYKDMIEFFKVKPEECVYVGDNPKKDFIGARKLNMKTIRIKHTNGDHINDIAEGGYEADFLIKNLQEIKKIVKYGNGVVK